MLKIRVYGKTCRWDGRWDARIRRAMQRHGREGGKAVMATVRK